MSRTPAVPARAERRSPTPAAIRKREAIQRLKAALDKRLFALHYQPIVDAREGTVTSAEALLRWRSSGKEHAPPGDLMCAAERSPVIFRLENWTLEQAFRDAAGWTQALPGLRVQVNLSAREFPRADLVRRVTRRLEAAGLTPGQVGLEITESSGISEFDAVAEQLEALEALGFDLWLDDFGTGHSSLEWLSHLPLQGVKIAGTFVERLFTEKRCQPIVTHVIALAHDLGLRVIAEGVETAEQRDCLAGQGCDLFQGYLFHPSMAAAEMPRAIAGRLGTSKEDRSS
jgi:EAL domain-containing protein (putative c-di-GMP-specific phosphodiesterase class I)